MTQHSDCNKTRRLPCRTTCRPDDVARFDSHLEACAECREAIDEQKVGRQSFAIASANSTRTCAPQSFSILSAHPCPLPPVSPPHLASRSRLSGRRGYWSSPVGWLQLNRQAKLPSISKRPRTSPLPSRFVQPPPSRPQATFVASTDAIVVPLESPSTDVTVVQVYQTNRHRAPVGASNNHFLSANQQNQTEG